MYFKRQEKTNDQDHCYFENEPCAFTCVGDSVNGGPGKGKQWF